MFKRILVATDGSTPSAVALDQAIGLSRSCGARLRLVLVIEGVALLSVVDPYDHSTELMEVLRQDSLKVLDESLARVRAAGVDGDCVLLDKSGLRLGEAVAQAAQTWEADLVVCGTHGRRGMSRLMLGSGADQIIRLATVPVLIVRAPDAQAQSQEEAAASLQAAAEIAAPA